MDKNTTPLTASEIAAILERKTLTDAEAVLCGQPFMAGGQECTLTETSIGFLAEHTAIPYLMLEALRARYKEWYPRAARVWMRDAIARHATPVTVERFDVGNISEAELVKVIRAEVCRLIGETPIVRPPHEHDTADVTHDLVTLSDAEYLREKAIDGAIKRVSWPRGVKVTASIASYDCACTAEETPRWLRVRFFARMPLLEVTINVAI